MRHGTLARVLVLSLFTGLCRQAGIAQSLMGTTGLVMIPTAELAGDGEVFFGVNGGNRQYNVLHPGKFHHYSYFATLGYLPFLEVSLRLTRDYHFSWSFGDEGLGDRMASVRLKLMGETRYRPSIVLGVHDILSAFEKSTVVYFNALYLVGSKHIHPLGSQFRLGLHMGYGSDQMEARRHEYTGWFGGISIEVVSRLTLMMEHDSEKFNGGAEVQFFDRIRILLALIHLDSFAGSLSYSLRLQ
ncbi:YjbH domain-containing protein [bacterium]|nr:YjbH domain-containing protein [bacterium]